MPHLAEAIKRATQDVINQSQLSDYTTGVIVSLSPLRVRISEKITLTKEFLLITKSLKGSYPLVGVGEGRCIHEMEVGDTILLLKKQGGQQYVMIDKVVEI